MIVLSHASDRHTAFAVDRAFSRAIRSASKSCRDDLMTSRHSASDSIAPCQRYTLRTPGTMVTHAATRASTSTRASLAASSSVAQVLNTTILSVISENMEQDFESDVTIIFLAVRR